MKKNINNSLVLMPISEEEIGKFNKMGDIYILYYSIFSNDIEISLIDNYLFPDFFNTTILEYTDSKAYFYDLDSSYIKYNNDERRSIYEVIPALNNTIESYKIINGEDSLEDYINTKQVNKNLIKVKNS